MRASFTVALVALLFSGGCSQIFSPTLPTSVSSPSSASVPTGVAPKLGATALYDSALDGSAYRFDTFDGTSLTFHNNQNSYTITYDTDTKFRRAVLQSWAPTDPYYPFAEAYNAANAFGDGWTAVLGRLVGGNVRIVLLPPNPIRPGDPYHIASFQPIP